MLGYIRIIIAVLLLCLLSGISEKLFASQFYGGELNYTYISGDANSATYRITYKIYRNCKSYSDLNEPYVWFFNTIERTPPTNQFKIKLDQVSKRRLNNTKATFCGMNPPDVCCDLIEYAADVVLPASEKGYLVYITDCCRAADQKNLSYESWNSGSEMAAGVIVPGQALTYVTKIPPPGTALVNSSPVMINDSSLTACLDKPYSYRFRYSDPDGDELRFSFGKAIGKTAEGNTLLDEIPYANGYSVTEPFGTGSGFSIDPVTGVLTGTPRKTGNYTIVLEIGEYRNGNLINVHRAEFDLVVMECRAYLPAQPVICTKAPAFFSNNPNGSTLSHSWDFGVDGTDTDRSNAIYPVYQYQAAGEYTVTLALANADGCKDTVRTVVKYFPDLSIDFSYKDSICSGEPIVLTNLSSFPSGTITSYQWQYISGRGTQVFSRSRDASLGYTFNDSVRVGYSVQLTITTDKGCGASMVKVPFVYPVPNAYAGPDTTISFDVPYEMPVRQSQVNSYLWQPAFGLSDTRIANPYVTGGQNQCYTITVWGYDSVCTSKDEVCITYGRGPAVHVPTAFSPNGDGINDRLKFRPVQVKVISIEIFNRYGNRVFVTDDPSVSWDGRVNGSLPDGGAFIWVVKGIGPNNTPFNQSGSVLLIR